MRNESWTSLTISWTRSQFIPGLQVLSRANPEGLIHREVQIASFRFATAKRTRVFSETTILFFTLHERSAAISGFKFINTKLSTCSPTAVVFSFTLNCHNGEPLTDVSPSPHSHCPVYKSPNKLRSCSLNASTSMLAFQERRSRKCRSSRFISAVVGMPEMRAM